MITPVKTGYPTSQLSHGENSPQRSRLPRQADRVTCLGGIPHLTCERDQEKKKNGIKKKREIVWIDWLPHQGRGPHLPEVPHFHVNRPLIIGLTAHHHYHHQVSAEYKIVDRNPLYLCVLAEALSQCIANKVTACYSYF